MLLPIISIQTHGYFLYIMWHNANEFNLSHDTLMLLRDGDFDTWALVGIQWMETMVQLKFRIKSWHVMGINAKALYYVDEIFEKLGMDWQNNDQQTYTGLARLGWLG